MNRTTMLTAGSALGLFAAAGILTMSDGSAVGAPAGPVVTPGYLELTGVVRDFKESNKPGGHPDFMIDSQKPDKGYGQYCGNVSTTLGEDAKPVFTGGGYRVTTQWKDSANRPICYNLFNAALGDVAGVKGATSNGGITSETSFNQWFRDDPTVNMSMPLTIKLVKGADGSYVFDDKLDPHYDDLGGFFPIEGQLYGNPGGSPDRNFHFTYELHAEFTYKAGTGQVFKFIGDDDVWVYINKQLVIDLGGVHGATEQYVAVDRLGLQHNKRYSLDFFFAERHRTQSNFRIQTNLILESDETPSVTAAFD